MSVEEVSKEKLIWIYETMLKIRTFEEIGTTLYNEGKPGLTVPVSPIPGWYHCYAGEESIAVGVMANLRKSDYITSTHRGHGHLISKGGDLKKIAAELYGKKTGYNKGKGGSMHVADLNLGILGANGMVGAGIPIATGAGYALKMKGTDNVVVSFFGDGASNTATFHEGINLGSILKVPVIYVCENNGFAISKPQKKAMNIVDISARASAYGIPGVSIDGSDVMAIYEAAKEAIERARRGEGPSLIEVKTCRLHGHFEGDPQVYRSKEDIERCKEKDPVKRFKKALIEKGVISEEEAENLSKKVKKEVNEAFEYADQSPFPDPKEAFEDVYPGGDPKIPSEVLTEEEVKKKGTFRDLEYREAINEAIREEMRKDKTVYVIGEDVGVMGGIYGVTSSLINEFGPERVIDSPISETAIISSSVGAAMVGMRPIAEIMFSGFLGVCMEQIYNQAAKLPYMSGGYATIPLVIRTPNYSEASVAAQHSERNEAWFVHTPGIKVIAPSTPFDAKGLMKTAIRDDNPVIFFEHVNLYWGVKAPVPKEEYMIPLGKADIKRPGKDVTIVTYSWFVHRALSAAEKLSKDGIEAEIIDLRTLSPWDKATVIDSVKKTNKLIVFEEDAKQGGVGAEIVATVIEEALPSVKVAKRVAAADAPIPFSPTLEKAVIPQEEDLIKAVKEIS